MGCIAARQTGNKCREASKICVNRLWLPTSQTHSHTTSITTNPLAFHVKLSWESLLFGPTGNLCESLSVYMGLCECPPNALPLRILTPWEINTAFPPSLSACTLSHARHGPHRGGSSTGSWSQRAHRAAAVTVPYKENQTGNLQ